jgi:DHA1 family multidrug resistance protein-like MFS transporter
MYDVIRDSTFGQIVRYATGNKHLQYSEEREGFQHPHYVRETEKSDMGNLAVPLSEEDGHGDTSQHLPTSVTTNNQANSISDNLHLPGTDTESEDLEDALEANPIERLITQQSLQTLGRERSLVIEPTKTADGAILVDWYATGEESYRG